MAEYIYMLAPDKKSALRLDISSALQQALLETLRKEGYQETTREGYDRALSAWEAEDGR